jgi:hypothetical protein
MNLPYSPAFKESRRDILAGDMTSNDGFATQVSEARDRDEEFRFRGEKQQISRYQIMNKKKNTLHGGKDVLRSA